MSSTKSTSTRSKKKSSGTGVNERSGSLSVSTTSGTSASAGKNDRRGRETVHGRLRSILMSPTSYTLFRGFHQEKSAKKNGANFKLRPLVEIDGLPEEKLPDFFQFEPQNSELITLFSRAVDDVVKKKEAGGAGEENIVDTSALKKPSNFAEVDANETAKVTDQQEADDYACEVAGEDSRHTAQAADSTTSGNEEDDFDDTERSDVVGGLVVHPKNDEVRRIMERSLTTMIIGRLQLETQKGHLHFTAGEEVPVDERRGRTDLVLTRKNKSQIPVALVEFGLLDKAVKLEQFFWEKTDQATQYLEMIRKDSYLKWEKSLLLGVLVATRDLAVGRLAVFACEPKGADSWRMALLWRSQLESQKLSEAFGAFLNAADYLAKTGDEAELAKTGDEVAKEITWEYLGPDCTMVEIKGEPRVARSFDNRGRHSSRTPQVYKDWDELSKDRIDLFIIQDNDDSDNTLDFAAKYEGNERNDKSMLFSKWNKPKGGKNVEPKGGKVEVITVPYHEGTHVCTSFIQLLSLLYYVKDMLEKGFVHGDMRGRNMVFKPPPKNLKRSDFLLESSDPKESQEIQERLAAKDRPESCQHQESATNQVVTTDQQDGANDLPLFAQKQLGTDDLQVADQQGSDSTDNQLIAKDQQEVSAESEPDAAHAKNDKKDANDEGVKIDPKKFVYACLIDFDYGGHLKNHKPTYPPGYRVNVGDGTRNKGKAGEAIEPEHDITAMTNFLYLHDLEGEISDYVSGLWRKLLQTKDLDLMIELAIKLFRVHPTGVICPRETYTDCLNKYKTTIDRLTAKGGNKVTPDRYGKAIDDE